MHRSAAEHLVVDRSLIDELLASNEYELVETHISWLLLGDEFVYKIKKPVDLGFLDFSDLGKRRHYCEEEVRLNRPHCPGIYVDVVPIARSRGLPVIGGKGVPIEYAVRMRRFDASQRLDCLLETGKLDVGDMSELAEVVARRHETADRIDVSERQRTVERVGEFALDNFEPLTGSVDGVLMERLRRWTGAELARLDGTLWERFDRGRYRECHGDLHLGNIVRLAGGIATFDCLEFDAALRNTDVMADVAFVVMDLASRNRTDLASHFLNRYLEVTGDYEGMKVFNLYFTYRCLVRAKVAVIRGSERGNAQDRLTDIDEANRYCRLAGRQVASRRPLCVAMHGFSGSGKTWVSSRLMDGLPAIRVRSDIERKRLFGLDAAAVSGSGLGSGLYSSEATASVYARLGELASMLLESGHSVIVDAAFLDRSKRGALRQAVQRSGASCCYVDVRAPEALLRRRLAERAAAGHDASEADEGVLNHQLAHAEAFATEEKPAVITINSEDFDPAVTIAAIRAFAGPR